MEGLLSIAIFVLPSVLFGVGTGYYLGYTTRRGQLFRRLHEEREKTLQALLATLESAEQLNTDIGSHNVQIREVGRAVGDLHVPGEFEHLQQALLGKIKDVLASNRRLEKDLVCTRYHLEEQAQELDRTRREARTDALAGVGNRKDFDEALSYWLAKHGQSGHSFALVLCDVDCFKWINDTHGHQAGDRVVNQVGSLLKASLRPGDYVGRYGGDEFVLMLADVSAEQAAEAAERIRIRVTQQVFDVGLLSARVSVTFSMGLTMAREGDTPETVIARADRGMYRSKQLGRNQLQLCLEDEEAESPAAPVLTPSA